MFQFVQRERVRVRPVVKMLLITRRDRADLCLLAVCGDKELVVIENPFIAFAFRAALLAVAKHLVNSFGDGFFNLWRFAVSDGDGQAVQKEGDVGNDVLVCAGDANLELADGDERIVRLLFEINVIDGRADLARFAVAVSGCAFK